MVAVKGVPGQCRLHEFRLVLLRLGCGTVRAQVYRRLILHGDLDLVSVFGKDCQLVRKVLHAEILTGIGVRKNPVRGIGLADRLEYHPATDEPFRIRSGRRSGDGLEIAFQRLCHVDLGVLLLRLHLNCCDCHQSQEQKDSETSFHCINVLQGSTWSCRCQG